MSLYTFIELELVSGIRGFKVTRELCVSIGLRFYTLDGGMR